MLKLRVGPGMAGGRASSWSPLAFHDIESWPYEHEFESTCYLAVARTMGEEGHVSPVRVLFSGCVQPLCFSLTFSYVLGSFGGPLLVA